MTNETHFDPDAEIREYVLRQKSTATADENLQEMTPKNKSKPLHMAGGVSYYTRIDLIFYNDETEAISDIVVKDARPTKPKRELNATDEEFEIKLAE